MKRYEIHLIENLFGVVSKAVWKAPNENAKDCMLKSANEYGFVIEKVEEVEA